MHRQTHTNRLPTDTYTHTQTYTQRATQASTPTDTQRREAASESSWTPSLPPPHPATPAASPGSVFAFRRCWYSKGAVRPKEERKCPPPESERRQDSLPQRRPLPSSPPSINWKARSCCRKRDDHFKKRAVRAPQRLVLAPLD